MSYRLEESVARAVKEAAAWINTHGDATAMSPEANEVPVGALIEERRRQPGVSGRVGVVIPAVDATDLRYRVQLEDGSIDSFEASEVTKVFRIARLRVTKTCGLCGAVFEQGRTFFLTTPDRRGPAPPEWTLAPRAGFAIHLPCHNRGLEVNFPVDFELDVVDVHSRPRNASMAVVVPPPPNERVV
jgi:hypothetical protein